MAQTILPSIRVLGLVSQGAALDCFARMHAGPLAMSELRNSGKLPSCLAGAENDEAIARYNTSRCIAIEEMGFTQAVACEVKTGDNHKGKP